MSTDVTTETPNSAANTAYRKFLCVICGYIYDEELGAPDEGIDPGTLWDDISPTWTCPDCGATKEDFEVIEI